MNQLYPYMTVADYAELERVDALYWALVLRVAGTSRCVGPIWVVEVGSRALWVLNTADGFSLV